VCGGGNRPNGDRGVIAFPDDRSMLESSPRGSVLGPNRFPVKERATWLSVGKTRSGRGAQEHTEKLRQGSGWAHLLSHRYSIVKANWK
jgi:hypothetical protein